MHNHTAELAPAARNAPRAVLRAALKRAVPAMAAIAVMTALLGLPATPAIAQAASNCQAIARVLPAPPPAAASPERVMLAAAEATPASAQYEVSITYVGHSSFRIVAPDGTTIVTDYSGRHGGDRLPDVVTMNHAHITHWTSNPDPGIAHVLRGWNPEGGRAEHFLEVGEVLVRNVPTDIRSYAGTEENGNSIFIFEIAGLCIGHLGHLHQVPTDEQYAEIGRLDIVLVPIDGTYTMNQTAMMGVVERLRASMAIPMHWFSQYTLGDFVTRTGNDGLKVSIRSDPTISVSLNTLPDEPTLVVLPRQLPF